MVWFGHGICPPLPTDMNHSNRSKNRATKYNRYGEFVMDTVPSRPYILDTVPHVLFRVIDLASASASGLLVFCVALLVLMVNGKRTKQSKPYSNCTFSPPKSPPKSSKIKNIFAPYQPTWREWMPLANNVYSTRWKQVGRFQASISACWKQDQNPCTNKHNEKVAGILCVAVRAADAAHSSPQELTKKMKQFVPFQPTSRGTKFQQNLRSRNIVSTREPSDSHLLSQLNHFFKNQNNIRKPRSIFLLFLPSASFPLSPMLWNSVA